MITPGDVNDRRPSDTRRLWNLIREARRGQVIHQQEPFPKVLRGRDTAYY